MRFVILGEQGSGKDTLVENLKKVGNYKSISTGQIYRDAANKKTELGVRAKNEFWGKGLICPDEMTNEIMYEALKGISGPDTLLINGYPRSLGQAKFLDTVCQIDGLIHLQASDEIVIQRLLKRNREDDTLDIINKRLEIYHKNAESIIAYYKKSNRYIHLDAESTPQDVLKEALSKLSR